MKLKLLLTFTALVLALCFTLAACGEQQTSGATPDTATADTAEQTKSAATAPANAAADASSQEETASSASSSPASSASLAPVANNAENPNILYEEDVPAAEEQQEIRQEEQQKQQSPASSAASPQTSSKASSGNPAYQNDDKPVFTISMTNKKTKKTYSASCNYTTDKEEVASTSFFLPGGEYDIAVYEYSEAKDKGVPLAEATYKNAVSEKDRKSIHVEYTPKDNKIEVKVSTSSRNQ